MVHLDHAYKKSAVFVLVTMDESCPSIAIQVSSDPTPAEVVIITLSERNGSFQVSLGTGECKLPVFFFSFLFLLIMSLS